MSLASSQFVPQKYVASASVGDQAFCVGSGEGRGVTGSGVGRGVFIMGYGEGRGVIGCCVGREVVAPLAPGFDAGLPFPPPEGFLPPDGLPAGFEKGSSGLTSGV